MTWFDEELKHICDIIQGTALICSPSAQEHLDQIAAKYPPSPVQPIDWSKVSRSISYDISIAHDAAAFFAAVRTICAQLQIKELILVPDSFADCSLRIQPEFVAQTVQHVRKLPGGQFLGPTDWRWVADLRWAGAAFLSIPSSVSLTSM